MCTAFCHRDKGVSVSRYRDKVSCSECAGPCPGPAGVCTIMQAGCWSNVDGHVGLGGGGGGRGSWPTLVFRLRVMGRIEMVRTNCCTPPPLQSPPPLAIPPLAIPPPPVQLPCDCRGFPR